MRRAGLIAVVVWVAMSFTEAPPAQAVRAADWTTPIVGRMSIRGVLDFSGWELAVSRSLLDRVEVAVVVGSQAPMRFEGTARVLDLVPFRISIGYRAGRLTAAGSLHIGPVRLALKRDIARRCAAHWTVAAALAPRIALAVEGALRTDPEVEVTLLAFSAAPPLTVCSLTVAAQQLRVSAGVEW